MLQLICIHGFRAGLGPKGPFGQEKEWGPYLLVGRARSAAPEWGSGGFSPGKILEILSAISCIFVHFIFITDDLFIMGGPNRHVSAGAHRPVADGPMGQSGPAVNELSISIQFHIKEVEECKIFIILLRNR